MYYEISFFIFLAKPAHHSQAAEQSDQISFIYGSQYDQFPRGNQYPSHGGASYSGNQYQPQNNAQDQGVQSISKTIFIHT